MKHVSKLLLIFACMSMHINTIQGTLKKFLENIDPEKEPEKYEKALDQFAGTVIKRIAVLQEIKQKKVAKVEKEIKHNIQQTPLTQTLSYLNPKHEDNFDYDAKIQEQLNDFGDLEKKGLESEYLTKMIKNIICTEQSYAPDYYVFYSALAGNNPIGKEPGPGLLFDIYAEIIQCLGISPAAKNTVLRFLSPEEYENVTDLLNSTKEYLPETFDSKRTSYDHKPKLKKYLISTNLSLFGSNVDIMECTFNFWLNSRSIGAPQTINSLKEIFEKFNFDAKKIDDLVKNYITYHQEAGGNLLQIFIGKNMVNQIAYLSLVYGIPLYYKNVFLETFQGVNIKEETYNKLKKDNIITDPFIKNNSLSYTLEKYINDKNFYKYCPDTGSNEPWFDPLQARVLWNKKFFSDESKVKIFRYYAKKHVDEKAYKQALHKIFDEIIKDWIIRRLKAKKSLVSKDSQEKNLDTLLDCLITLKESSIDPMSKSKKTEIPNETREERDEREANAETKNLKKNRKFSWQSKKDEEQRSKLKKKNNQDIENKEGTDEAKKEIENEN